MLTRSQQADWQRAIGEIAARAAAGSSLRAARLATIRWCHYSQRTCTISTDLPDGSRNASFTPSTVLSVINL